MLPRRNLSSILVVLALAVACALMAACGAPSANQAEPEHAATVQVLLPAADPTAPPAPESRNQAQPDRPTATARPADTPVPAADTSVPPTYTPRPLPTYTPRPAPAPASGGDRTMAVRFEARTLDGTVITLADTVGTPTLLAFWAPW